MACWSRLLGVLTGSTSSTMPWPKDHVPKELSEDERLEKMMKKFHPLGADLSLSRILRGRPGVWRCEREP